MTTREEYIPILNWFTSKMDKKLGLPKNIEKGSWSYMTWDELLDRLDEEVEELRLMIEDYRWLDDDDKPSREDVIGEAADVANFAMMIADNIRNDI